VGGGAGKTKARGGGPRPPQGSGARNTDSRRGGHRLSAVRLVGIGRPARSAAADRRQAQYRVCDALSGGEIRRVSREASRAAGAGNAGGILAIPQARPPGGRVLDQNLQSIARGLQAAVVNE